jgi:pimeloyl-ACP methyl ester carboxylesterase
MSYLEIADRRVFYSAPRQLPPNLVLVHGFGGSSRQFTPLLEELGDDVVPLAIDLPGCGRSSGEALTTVADMAQLVVDVVDALSPERRPFTLLGHSFGGLVAAQAACTNPARVERLVVVASAPRIRLHPEMAVQATSGEWNEEFLRGSFGPLITEEHIQLVLDDMRAMRLPRGVDLIERWTSHDIRTRLGDIAARTLVVVPSDDVVVSPRNGAIWAKGIPDCRQVTIAGAGHYVQLEKAADLAACVRQFISEEVSVVSILRDHRPQSVEGSLTSGLALRA